MHKKNDWTTDKMTQIKKLIHTNKLVIGILAHVDAGKTTLAESILYLRGEIRKPGRVDHGNAFLDTYELERSRGITIFSKQAEAVLGEKSVTLLDTPGHVDFSAEMERTLQVLDYAVLVISGADGVQGHVETLWRLLRRYSIPVFLFSNKMDQPGCVREKLLDELKVRLDERCIEFGADDSDEDFMENLAMCDEKALEAYLEKGSISREETVELIRARKVFPCYFGSALKVEGVEEFLQGLDKYTGSSVYPEEFGAKIYKISRDAQGNRLTHMKITGGALKVKMQLSDSREEKADQIRIYSGASFRSVKEAPAGTICAVTGLDSTYSGEGIGIEEASEFPVLEPVLTYQIQLPEDCDVHGMFLKLCQLEEEEPQLHIVWNEQLQEIHAQVMGEVQIEILKSMIQERFGVKVEFGSGSIVYKETILEPVEGVGHFEPLRHYAEVHLLLEPLEAGSGLQFATACSEDILDGNWQRLVLTHLEEKRHPGVLTGAEITDMRITLLTGRSHLKHTEGGDFRQATYRAVRQGLKMGKCILLEPVYEFRLEVPSDKMGRAISDIQKMYGSFKDPQIDGEMTVITGRAPTERMQGYQREVTAYTSGRGRLSCSLAGYEPCHNAEEVIEAAGYDSEKDLENPTGSVFCAHGAGFVVSWDKVRDYMHLESVLKNDIMRQREEEVQQIRERRDTENQDRWADPKELEEIFERTYGPVKRERNRFNRGGTAGRRAAENIQSSVVHRPKTRERSEEYLLVDGYNIIFAWEDLRELAEVNIEGARNKLMDVLCNYQGFKKMTLILVFDAYKVPGNKGDVQKYHNIFVVYTKEAETADQYIEKAVHEIGRKHHVTVATSDALEQVIILGQGADRMSAQGLKDEVELVRKEIRSEYLEKQKSSKNYLFENLPEDMARHMEDVRLGYTDFDKE